MPTAEVMIQSVDAHVDGERFAGSDLTGNWVKLSFRDLQGGEVNVCVFGENVTQFLQALELEARRLSTLKVGS